MLFTPQSHESLTETMWDDEAARAAIRAIVADAEDAFDDGTAARRACSADPRHLAGVLNAAFGDSKVA